MRTELVSILVGLVFVIGMMSINTRPAYAANSSCTASLDSSQVVPPVDSNGTGSATMTYDSSSNQLTWSIQFSGLSGPATAAHFHGPAAAGANAGAQINIANISGLNSPMNGSAVLTAEQASMLLDGLMYINIHTELHPSEEIRGQVSCIESPPGEVWKTATLAIGNDEFDIKYMISGGTLDELTGNVERETITAMITATEVGSLTIQLPREIADSVDSNGTDSDYIVLVDGVDEESINDDFGQDVRTLTIPFPAQSEQIEIKGTFVVPEFGAVAGIVLAAAVLTIIAATTRSNKFSFMPKM